MAKIKMHEQVTHEVDAGPRGRRIGALFDLDKTLITDFSAMSFMQGRIKSGNMTSAEIFANLTTILNYIRGEREFADMVATTTAALRGLEEDAFVELGEQIFQKHLAATIYPEARALVEAHRSKGHTLAIISSATPYQIQPVARELGIDHVLCTRFEVENGRFTGEVEEPVCWGEGKATAAKTLAVEQGLALDRSYFYTDSIEDLPLLEEVGKPRPLNADDKLAALADERRWPVQNFSRTAKPDIKQVVRNAAVAAGLIPSAFVGIPVKYLTGSTRDGADAAMKTWVELACAAIGIDVQVSGREHVWSHRPCVFIYNHQCAADTMIIPMVLERDFVGVAKKEAADAPIYGSFMKAVGTVLIDRSDSAKARADLEPAMQALASGESIVIAPEGTRRNSTKLGEFKKGAFHIAMQAGVPIVPFVVHNAIDVLPPGTKVYRAATVEVEVLPPIPTDEWRAEDIDSHVATVRNLFLERLGQPLQAIADQGKRRTATARKRKSTKKKLSEKRQPAANKGKSARSVTRKSTG